MKRSFGGAHIWATNYSLSNGWSIGQISITPNSQLVTFKVQAEAKNIIDTVRIISLTWNLVTKKVSGNVDAMRGLKIALQEQHQKVNEIMIQHYLETIEKLQ